MELQRAMPRGQEWGPSGGGKRKRLEPIVASSIIVGQSSQYQLAEYEDQGECSKKVCVTAHHSFTPGQDVRGAHQQLTINTHTGSVQPAQTGHSALLHTATEKSKAGCKNVCSGSNNAEQVCFGMVRIFSCCCLQSPVTAESSLTCVA